MRLPSARVRSRRRNARPGLECLEDRRVPASLVVANANDSGAGSLREAIAQANLDADADTITFAPAVTGTIALSSSLPDLTTAVTLTGPGASALEVARSGAAGMAEFRVFTVTAGANVTISGLTIRNGRSGRGGGAFNAGTLTVADSVFAANTATGLGEAGGTAAGGGISSVGTLTVSNSLFSGNAASGQAATGGSGGGAAFGGGIDSAGPLTVSSSTFDGNSARGGDGTGPSAGGGSAAGGGLSNRFNGLMVTSSHFTNNMVVGGSAPGGDGGLGSGGGLYMDGEKQQILASYLTGNAAEGGAGGRGGGLYSAGAFNLLQDSNVGGNTAVGGEDRTGAGIAAMGGGIFTAGQISVNGSIVEDNTAEGIATTLGGGSAFGGGIYADAQLNVFGSFLVRNVARGVVGFGDTPGGDGKGGAVYNTFVSSIASSQVNLNQAIGSDAGAGAGGAVYNIGGIGITDTAIRSNQALGGTRADGGGLYNEALLILATSQIEDNAALSSGSTSGGGLVTLAFARVSDFQLNRNTAGNGAGWFNAEVVDLSSSLITNNAATGAGGAILNAGTGTMTIDGVTFYFNTSGNSGGALDNRGTATIENSLFGGNSAPNGGAIANRTEVSNDVAGPGDLTIRASTLGGNSATEAGGAIDNFANATIVLSTLVNNTAGVAGGAIENRYELGEFGLVGGLLTLASTTLTDNAAGTGGAIHNDGQVSFLSSIFDGNRGGSVANFPDPAVRKSGNVAVSLGYNLFSDVPILSGAIAVGDRANTPTLLAPLGNYGGPTPTRALLPGSVALDASIPIAGETVDQRGVPRPGTGSAPDIGAFESRGFTLNVNSGNDQAAALGTAFAAPLVVRVEGVGGEPVAGGQVGFLTLSSGATAALAGNPATIDGSGLASVRAGAVAAVGSYPVSAVTAGGQTVATFLLTNVTPPPPPPPIVIHPAVVAVRPFILTLTPGGAKRFSVAVAFNEGVNASAATDPATYRLRSGRRTAGGGAVFPNAVALRTITYDATTHTATLVTRGRSRPRGPLKLSVLATPNLTDAAGNRLAGNFVTIF